MEKTPMAEKSATAPGDLHQVESTWSPYHQVSETTRARLRELWTGLGFNQGTASQIRYELDMLLLRARGSLSREHRQHVRALSAASGLKIHLGCGNALFPGWINVDCYPPTPQPGIDILTIDVRRGLPLAGGSVAALFSEHFLEHLPFATVCGVILPEIRRVLEPGGHIHIGVPDGEYFINQYIACREGRADPLFEQNRRGATPMTMLNEIAHGFGHHFAYDFQTMRVALEAADFRNVRRVEPDSSTVAAFQGKDRADDWRRAMTLYVEAQAPGQPGK
jgi:predicted SAM-dependent methyltransferase